MSKLTEQEFKNFIEIHGHDKLIDVFERKIENKIKEADNKNPELSAEQLLLLLGDILIIDEIIEDIENIEYITSLIIEYYRIKPNNHLFFKSKKKHIFIRNKIIPIEIAITEILKCLLDK